MRESLVVLLPLIAAGCPLNNCYKEDEYYEETFAVSAAELEAALDDDGELSAVACEQLCYDHRVLGEVTSCELVDASLETADTGPAHALRCSMFVEAQCSGGRGHAAVVPASEPTAASAVGAWLAASAHAEAASVKAFLALEEELAHHGAPSSLRDACRRAALDEVAHARGMGALAAEHGAAPVPLRFTAVASRSLEAIATENVVEGCVRETWAATMAFWQAQAAGDPSIRRAMATIAVDESRHAELAHEIHAWAMEQLPNDARERVSRARDEAVRELGRSLEEPEAALVEQAGLPGRERAVGMWQALVDQVWLA